MEEKVAFYYVEKGKYSPKEGVPYVRRENIAAIVMYKGKFLLLSWNEVDYEKSLVTGGIEPGEDRKLATQREVIEETGYYDIEHIESINCINVSKFFVEHKNQNREAVYYPFLVELHSLDRKEVDPNEEKEHSCIWIEEEDINTIKIFENHKMMLKKTIEHIKSREV